MNYFSTSLVKSAPNIINKPSFYLSSSVIKRNASNSYYKKEAVLRKTKRTNRLIVFALVTSGGIIGFSLPPKYKTYFSVPNTNKEKVVILGTGWGALSVLDEIDTNFYDVSVVSPRNYFLFTPLLPSIAVGKMHNASTTEPIRKFLSRSNCKDSEYFEAYCKDIDPTSKTITCVSATADIPFDLEYDKLIIAVGSKVSTGGVPGVKEHCNFLREVDDASHLQSKIIKCFEEANVPGQSEDEKKKLLNFLVVGGGPTSIEFVNQLSAFVDNHLRYWFPGLGKYVQITLVDKTDHITNTYERRINDIIRKVFPVENTHNINIRHCSNIKAVKKDEIIFESENGKEEKVPFGFCLWSTALEPIDLTKNLMQKVSDEQTNANALTTDDFLNVKGFEDIYAIGDCATIEQRRLRGVILDLFKEHDENGDGYLDFEEFTALLTNEEIGKQYPQIGEFVTQAEELFQNYDVNKDGVIDLAELKEILTQIDSVLTKLPSTAQTAQQEGRFLGKYFNYLAEEDDDDEDEDDEEEEDDDDDDDNEFEFGFRYKHLGGFEYVGYDNSITERGSPETNVVNGLGAWWMWRSINISRLVSLKIRSQMLFDRTGTVIFGRDYTQ